MRQRRAIRPVELPGTAELALAKLGAAAPKLGRSLVVKGEAPLRVRPVDRGRKCLYSLSRETVDITQSMDSARAVGRNTQGCAPLSCDGHLQALELLHQT